MEPEPHRFDGVGAGATKYCSSGSNGSGSKPDKYTNLNQKEIRIKNCPNQDVYIGLL
jgi:hypothetical protein